MKHFPIIFNMLICGIIGAAFGIPARAIPQWFAGGLLFGLVFGLVGEWVFRRFGQRIYRRRMLLLMLIEALVTIFIIIPLYASRSGVYPIRYPVSITPQEHDYQDVTFTTSDGIDLKGWYVPSENGAAVITLHGYNGNRTGVIYHLDALANHGYGVLAFDMRGHGESGGETFTGGWEGRWDVAAAVDLLKSQGIDHIGALGLSAGANEILNAMPYVSDIEAVIADGMGFNTREDIAPNVPEMIAPYWFLMSPLYWMFDRGVEFWSGVPAPAPFREVIPQIAPRPILFITGDDSFEQQIGQEFYKLAAENAEIWELPDTPHIGGILKHRDEYIARMLTFFDTHLN
jgi:uncharacterized protein